jgi:transcriptional regulator GlxA family with amidase domain
MGHSRMGVGRRSVSGESEAARSGAAHAGARLGRARRGARMVSICPGAFVPACWTGPATTHWRYPADRRACHPRVLPNRRYADDGDV